MNSTTIMNNAYPTTDSIPYRNIVTINVAKAFLTKNYEIMQICQRFDVAVLFMQDLGITETDRNKHFTKTNGTYLAKGYVLPNYSIFINDCKEEEFSGYSAIAVNNNYFDMDKVKVRKGLNGGKLDGRTMTIHVPLKSGDMISFISIYAPNKKQDSESYFYHLEKWLYRLKRKKRHIIIGGDFNATITEEERSGHSDNTGGNEWPSVINEYGIDAIHFLNPGIPMYTWQSYGEGYKAVIDHIIIDHSWIECVKTAFRIEMTSFSDHSPVLLNILIDTLPPLVHENYYKVVVDCSKLTLQNKMFIQKDLCEAMPNIERTMEEVLEGEGEECKLKFFSCVNEFADVVKRVACKYAGGDQTPKLERSLPFGWVKEVRELNKEIWMCNKLIEKLENFERRNSNQHSTTFKLKQPPLKQGIKYTFSSKLAIKELRDRKRLQDAETRKMLDEMKERHRLRVERLIQNAAVKESCRTPEFNYPSEFKIADIPQKVTNRMAFMNISKWEDIANWENTDILPLAVFRVISSSLGLGPIYWKRLRDYYLKNIAVNKCPVNRVYEANRSMMKGGVLMTIIADHPFILEESDHVTLIEYGERGQRKFCKATFNRPTKTLAAIVTAEEVDNVFQNLRSSVESITFKVKINDINREKNVEKTVRKSTEKWTKTWEELEIKNDEYKNLYTRIQEEIERETRSETEELHLEMDVNKAIPILKEFSKGKRKEIKNKSRELRNANILKAIKRNNELFHKAPRKLIKKRRALMENMTKKKLVKVTDSKGTHTSKEEVVNSAYEYYSKTAEARPIRDDVKYDFIGVCKESMGSISQESLEALTAPLSYTELLRKVFSTSNGSAPGADGIPYEILKTFPDCAFRIMHRIHNVILERGWCPDMFITGDVFLLAKVSEPTEHKHWRPVCLQSTIYKILMAVMADRLLHYALKNNIISEEQKGFCPVSGCFDHPGLLMNIIENFRQNKGELYVLFIDFFNAYGSVDHRRLIEVLRACGIPENIINFISSTLKGSSYHIHTGFGPTKPITLETGLKQGDPAAPVFFILFLEALIRMIKRTCTGYEFKYPFPHKIEPSSSQEFADDMVFTTDKFKEVEDIIDILEEFDKWSNMKVNASKCGLMAVKSDGEGEIIDLNKSVSINGEEIPFMDKYKSYKYLGFWHNIMGTHGDTGFAIGKKIETNLKLIDATPIAKWHKVTMAQWMIVSVPMYFLVNGRVVASRIERWNKQTRAFIRNWLGARNMANSAIHLPSSEHGLGITDLMDVNDERKLTTLTQFLYSNDHRLRESTIANIRTELGRRRVILQDGYSVLTAPKGPARGKMRKYTILYNIEKILSKYNLEMCIRKQGPCWCAFPYGFYSDMVVCKHCNQKRHFFCDPTVKIGKECRMCKLNNEVAGPPQTRGVYWEYFQNNRYNWADHRVVSPNPVWELSLGNKESRCKHHIFQHENGVWGVDVRKIKDIVVFKIKAGNKTGTPQVLLEIGRILKNAPLVHIEIKVNRKDICNALGNWAFNWVNRYQRTSTGREPAWWGLYAVIIQQIEERLPKITMFSFSTLKEEKTNVEEEEYEKVEVPRPEIGIHTKGVILNPIEASKRIMNMQVERYKGEWIEKRVQGMVGRVSRECTQHTSYFIHSNEITAEEKVLFMKLTLGLCVTKADKKKWGLINDATCSLCGLEEENIRHILTSCTALKHLYITRHNALLNVIMKYLGVLENLRVAIVDTKWDTVQEVKHNRPDIVIITPMDKEILPSPFNKTLREDCITVLDVTVVWDEKVEERRVEKIIKYLPLVQILKREMRRGTAECDAISVGVLGSITRETKRVLTSLVGVDNKDINKILKEINITLVRETSKIWKHAFITNSFS